MYPPDVTYYRAGTVEEAVALLQEHAGASLLAGGHSLIPAMKLRLADPGVLVDIGRIAGLKGITSSNGSVHVGALTTHAEVAASAQVPTVLSEAAGMIGDPQVRNRGTVGGNIAHADPASDLPTVLVALNATIHLTGPDGARTVPAAEFFLGMFTTAKGEGEILTGVEIQAGAGGSGSGYAKLYNPASRYAMVGVAAVVTMDGGTCTAARVVVGGLTPHATAAPSVEAALAGKTLDEASIAAAAQAVANDLGDEIISDMHASEAYRRAMAPVFVTRALQKASQRA